MRRWALRIGAGLLALVLSVLVLALVTLRGADTALFPAPPGAARVTVDIVSHGYHSGFAVARSALADSASRQGLSRLPTVLARFAQFPVLEFGWGDATFYRETPGVQDVQIFSALRALFMPSNAAVMHVVGLDRQAAAVFTRSDILRVELSSEGFDRLVRHIDDGFASPEPDGQGLYGPSLFYPGTGTFSLLQVCNHWVAGGLARAGLPQAPVLAVHPLPFFAYLEVTGAAQRLR